MNFQINNKIKFFLPALVVLVVGIGLFVRYGEIKSVYKEDKDLPMPIHPDCMVLKNVDSNAKDVNVTLKVKNIDGAIAKIKDFIKQNKAEFSDSESSDSDYNENIIDFYFKEAPKNFEKDFTNFAKNTLNIKDSDYSYESSGSYNQISAYDLCVQSYQDYALEVEKIKAFKQAIVKENNPKVRDLLNQAISDSKDNLIINVDDLNKIFDVNALYIDVSLYEKYHSPNN